MDAKDFQPKDDSDMPILERLMEEALAHVVDEKDRFMVIGLWILLGTNYMKREHGKHATREFIDALKEIILK